jgi:dTDP-4-amino-4,6-dideoxygalactose transaminase
MSFEKIKQFETAIAEFTGAPYAIMTDCCTHAIELCLRHDKITQCSFTPYTYLSIVMTMHKLGIEYQYLDHEWQRWVGEYPFIQTRIWDSARRLEQNMYRPGTMQCLSFGHSKPLHIGRGGAILLDDKSAYDTILCMRYDGRDLDISPWIEQKEFIVGFHYRPTPEEAVQGLALLEGLKVYCPPPQEVLYPDLRKITIHD